MAITRNNSTKESFDVFEPALLPGGVLVLHDVGCCAQECPGLVRFMQTHVLRNGSGYRELHFGAPLSWDSLPMPAEQELVKLLVASADRRAHTRRFVFRRTPDERRSLPTCAQMCTDVGLMTFANGYQWSMCPNVRVFQRTV